MSAVTGDTAQPTGNASAWLGVIGAAAVLVGMAITFGIGGLLIVVGLIALGLASRPGGTA